MGHEVFMYHVTHGARIFDSEISLTELEKNGWVDTPEKLDPQPSIPPPPVEEPATEVAPPEGGTGEGDGVETFTCEVCGKEFGHKLALSGHMRTHGNRG